MEELEFIKNERLRLQNIYLKEAKNIWTNFEGIEADKKHKKSYNEYRNKDYFLEGLQAKIEDILKDIEYYKENNQGGIIKMYIGIWKIMTESQKIRWIERNKNKFIKGGK